jgi:VCBS repeat-containing protein
MSGLPKGIRVSVNNTPQAQDDFYEFDEDGSTLRYLEVLDNDLGGEAKVLWSVDQDELLAQSGVDQWITLASGAKVSITAEGQIAYDYSAINMSMIQSLGEGDEFIDTFSYSIRLSNGTISTATVTLTYEGENDAATITGTNAGSVSAAGTLAEAVSYATGAYPSPHGLAVADVNGDGKADIITANHLSGNVSVLLNNGSGTFLSAPPIATGAAPDSVAIGDVNGDGRADIVTADGPSNQISVLLGNGDGTFQLPPTLFPSGIVTYTNAVALADLNGDTKLDAVCAGNDGVTLLLGNGNGTFAAPAPILHGVTRPADVVLAYMDNDSNLDIVTAGIDSDDVAILYGNGDGTFDAPSTFAVGNGPQNLAVGDLNSDGIADVVVSNTQADSVSVLLSDGTGGFALAQYTVGPAVPTGVALGDFNGDGHDDIVTSNAGGNLSVLLNDGFGEFGSPQLFATGSGSSTPSVGAADLDGDGRLDLVASDIANNRVWVLLNDGATLFASGDLDITDPDAGEDKFLVASPLEGTYGDFIFDTDTGEWTYMLDNDRSATQALMSGQTEYDTLQVTSLDGTANALITVAVHGATDWIV